MQPNSLHDFRRVYLKLNREEVIKVAHQPKDMIKECVYTQKIREKEKSCTDYITDGGTKIFTPAYGVCYMFNFKGLSNKMQPLMAIYPGEEYGLQLTLNIERKVSYI